MTTTTESVTTTQTPNVLTGLGFKRLSDGISLYEPVSNEKSRAIDSTQPTLIVLCSWAFAQPRHIAKYITPYQKIYPLTSILLVQNAISNALWWPDIWQLSFFQPAAIVIQQQTSRFIRPRVLVHAFSNGGSHAAVQLSQTCREVCGGLKMPVDALILDSAPGKPRFGPTIKALTLGVPSKNLFVKATAMLFAYGSIGMTAVLDILHLVEPAASKLYRVFNDPYDVFLQKGTNPVPRTYIYSKADEMIMEEDVLEHAQIAKSKLEELGVEKTKIEDYVRLEEFVGTAHVNHIKNDPDRYWSIVQETWSKAVELSD